MPKKVKVKKQGEMPKPVKVILPPPETLESNKKLTKADKAEKKG